MDQAEASGKTVEDARNKALAKLGARLDEVEFVVLDEGKRGGLFGRGAQDAVVRVTRIAGGARTSPLPEAPDTRIPRQGERGGQRRDGGGRQRQGRGGGQSRSGGGGGGGRGSRDSSRAGFEMPQPKLTDADFTRGASSGTEERTGDGRRGRGSRGGGGGGQGDRQRAPRPSRPPRDRSSRENEPPIEPDINAVEVDNAAQIVDDLLRIFDIDAEISIREPITAGDGRGSVLAVIDIKGEDLGLLIGRRGDTLIALQYLVNLILGRKYPGRGGVTIDVEHYKHRNEERIVSMANRMADRVRESGNPITLEPMSASERRLVHMIFAEDSELETNSIGEGDNRKVVISLRQ
ncbi:MAG: RNA-binding cell elongation regulator Jag/EloR [Dehalococcoidia bacterium]